MPSFMTSVPIRWSDMDVYGHVNNARVVTLLEEARTELLFTEGARRGAQTLAAGVIVVELAVRYRLPLVYSATPVRVRLWVSELRGASFTLAYGVSAAEGDGDAVTASTQLAPYETVARRPRRLTPAEREFLATFQDGVVTASNLATGSLTASATTDGSDGA
ncbi:MAG: acyl-CoA thioesterase [Pseudonocardiaceae bacterium]